MTAALKARRLMTATHLHWLRTPAMIPIDTSFCGDEIMAWRRHSATEVPKPQPVPEDRYCGCAEVASPQASHRTARLGNRSSRLASTTPALLCAATGYFERQGTPDARSAPCGPSVTPATMATDREAMSSRTAAIRTDGADRTRLPNRRPRSRSRASWLTRPGAASGHLALLSHGRSPNSPLNSEPIS